MMPTDHSGDNDELGHAESDQADRRTSSDSLLPSHEDDRPSSAGTGHGYKSFDGRRDLLFFAVPGILLCLFVIDFDIFFLSTNYSKRIASELHQLSQAVWIVLVGSITETTSQPVYAYLGQLMGRRRALLLAGIITALGFFLCSISNQLWTVSFSRLITGAGCAGFPLLVEIILNDNVQLEDFAIWRSLLVVVEMAGDISGGPAGSAIAMKFGWHLVFRLEFLIMLIGLIPIFLKLHLPTDVRSTPALSKEFDLAGTISLLFSVALPLVAVNVGGKIVPWSHPVCLTLLVCTPFALGAFYFFEKRATTPVFRLELLKHRPVMSIMACTFSIIYMFNAFTYNLALYIEARSFEKPSSFADWALSFISFARPFGTFISGLAIKRWRAPWQLMRGNVAMLLVLYLLIAAGLIPLENPALAPYFWLIGFAMGVAESCLIVSLFSVVPKTDQPAFLALFNLVVALAGDFGVGVALSLTETLTRYGLHDKLEDMADREEIIAKVLQSLENVRAFTPHVQTLVVGVFVDSIEKVFVLLIGIAAVFLQRITYVDEPDASDSED